MYLHRNTVRNRLTRFAELTGLDLDRTDDLVVAWWLLHREHSPPR
ncbi:helix-turn-helix domain-containing protein [Nocardia rhizosphaerihabitans]